MTISPTSAERTQPQAVTSLNIVDLHKSYRADKPVLKGINLKLSGAGLTAVIGPSGTGKSTLIDW
jgi:phosphonate transport system ATP-binding protein